MHSQSSTNVPILLDGGMGRELRFRGVELPATLWSAHALLAAPDVVRDIHLDYVRAGADIITTNTYGIVPRELAREGISDRYDVMNRLACTLAIQARDAAGVPVRIAGSLPPLGGSFRPDRVGRYKEIEPIYHRQARLLAPHVDLLLCETMSSSEEGLAAAHAACGTGKPVWVSWTLHEDRSGRLRSGETVAQALSALSDLPVEGYLANCCAPESITHALPDLLASGVRYVGGYANTFAPIPEDWTLDGDKKSDGFLDLREDLDPDAYARHVSEWLGAGASVVGGCCGTRPEHIKRIRHLLRGISSSR